MRITKRHLRLRGSQWALIWRLPPHLAERYGTKFLTRQLGTSDLRKANLMRDSIILEATKAEENLHQDERDREAEILAELEAIADPEHRATLEEVLEGQAEAKGETEGRRWYRRVTGTATPISFYVDQMNAQADTRVTTKLARKSAVAKFEEWCREPYLQDVSDRVAALYAEHLIAQGLAPKSVNSHLSHLSSYWRYLAKRRIVKANVWREQQQPPKQVIDRQHWTLEEVVELIDNAPTKLLRYAIAIGALSGMRADEIARLRVRDCGGGVFKVAEYYEGKTEASSRKVPIHSQLAAIIARLVVGRNGGEFLLPELKGRGKALSKRFSRYRKDRYGPTEKRQAEKTFHSLRHTFIHYRLQAGCELRLVEEVVGQKPQSVAERHYYSGMSHEQSVAVVEAVQLPLGRDE